MKFETQGSGASETPQPLPGRRLFPHGLDALGLLHRVFLLGFASVQPVGAPCPRVNPFVADQRPVARRYLIS